MEKKDEIAWNTIKQTRKGVGRASNHNVIIGKEGPRGLQKQPKHWQNHTLRWLGPQNITGRRFGCPTARV